jgi:NAD(P)-dependent dehydrogenase (short-subunit alcohol dehydrogenase family)
LHYSACLSVQKIKTFKIPFMAKVWFITGVSSGFGAALAQAVIEKGDAVAATFRKEEQATSFTQQYSGKGIGLVMDVTNQSQVEAAINQTVEQLGSIDVLVNNAGYGTIGALEEFSMDEIRAQMETNFFGAVAVTKQVLPLMRQKGSGSIVQISSASGFRAMAGFGNYNASKFALEGFSEALAQEVAPFGIQVVIVEPGPFRTQFAGSSVKIAQIKMQEYENTPVANMYRYINNIDGKQPGDPVRAAQAIVDYVHNGNKELRLPMGKGALDGIKAKLAAVEKDIAANEALALATDFPPGE